MSELKTHIKAFQIENISVISEKESARPFLQKRAKAKRDEDDKVLISQIDSWIKDFGYTENITVTEAAEKFGVTLYRIKRVFEEHYGMHFKEYKNHLRNERAKVLLETTSMSLAEISREVGYNDTSNFRKEFENEVKVAPREYRIQANSR